MDYNKKLIEMIVEELLKKSISKKIIKKFEPKSLLRENESDLSKKRI